MSFCFLTVCACNGVLLLHTVISNRIDHDVFYFYFLSSISFFWGIGPPEVMVFPPVGNVLIGKSTSFECNVTSTLEYILSWKFNGSPELPEGVIMVNDTVLEIHNAQPSHSGTYSCQADNQVHIRSFEAMLVVSCELIPRISLL